MARRFLVILAISSAGCSLLVGLDHLTGAGATPEAGAPTDGSSSVDGAVIDATGSNDDAGAVADAGADGGFCETAGNTHSLCIDFDHGEKLDQLGSVKRYGGGTFSFTQVGAISAPRSVLASTPAIVANDLAGAQLVVQVGSAPATATLRFSASVDQPSSNGTFSSISFGNYGVAIILGANGAHLQESLPNDGGPAFVSHIGLGVVRWGAAVEFVLAVERAADGSLLGSLIVDGNTVENKTPLDPRLTVTPVTIELGWGYVGGVSTPKNAVMDNILVDLGP